MPARIVLVHDDPKFRECAVTALQDAGHEVRAFSGSMEAIDALDGAARIELLITRVTFREAHRMAFHSPSWRA
jgi:DNA-binding NtrC family response regulator